MGENTGDIWVEVERFATYAEADEHALVLVAAGIDCQIAADDLGAAVLVGDPNLARAQRELAAYVRDTPSTPPPLPQRALGEAVAGTLVYCCVLLFVFGSASRGTFARDWLAAGEADAGLIVHGEWWRIFTALSLHGDYGHLVSNLVAGGFLGIVLSQIFGGGLAWLLILLAGAMGNGINAMIQPPGHIAIGASTAVFGAVGILAVLMTRYQAAIWQRGLRRWAPLTAGIMLLAFLGFEGERIDVGGYVCGFLAGCLLGACAIAAGEPSTIPRRSVDYFCGAFGFCLFIAAWLVALTG